MLRTIALAGLAALIAGLPLSVAAATPARAQIGNIFSDPVPRPPGNIPRGNQNQPPPDDEEEEVPALPQGRVLPAPNRPPPGRARRCRDRCSRSRWRRRPAPPSFRRTRRRGRRAAAAARSARPARCRRRQSALPGLPPGQRQPKGAPQRRRALQPGDEVVQEPPAQKIINKKASFSGLDKITGRIINFDEDIGETVQFGALRVKTDACYTRPATEAANTDAFVEVDEITLQGEVKRIFSGWMYAASPGLHGVEHPIYDIWLTDCKGPEQTIVSAAPDPRADACAAAAAGAEASAAAEAGRAASAAAAADSSSSSRRRHLRRRSSGRVCSAIPADCSAD